MAGDARIANVEGFGRLDLDRGLRTGVPEVVLAEGKTEEQALRLLAGLRAADPSAPALATRCAPELLRRAPDWFGDEPVWVDPVGRTVVVGELPTPRGVVAVLTAGTSDLPVAAEARATLVTLGVGCELIADVGIAGLGRLLGQVDALQSMDCLITIAGMEGALPSVVAGLVRPPIVAVPTSVGYGVSAGGSVAAAAMLASCAPGVTVVNVDNGFGAAAHAAKIVERICRANRPPAPDEG